jgi:hypothetical protein
VLIVTDSPTELAHRTDGDLRVWNMINQLVTLQPHNALILRRGPYVIAAGLDEIENAQPVSLSGTYVNLYDSKLVVHIDPEITPGTRSLWVDVERANPGHAWILAASGRVDDEQYTDTTLECTVSGAAQTIMVLRALLPRSPRSVTVQNHSQDYTWDAPSQTVFVSAAADPAGIHVHISF